LQRRVDKVRPSCLEKNERGADKSNVAKYEEILRFGSNPLIKDTGRIVLINSQNEEKRKGKGIQLKLIIAYIVKSA